MIGKNLNVNKSSCVARPVEVRDRQGVEVSSDTAAVQ